MVKKILKFVEHQLVLLREFNMWQILLEEYDSGSQIIAVVSAMSGKTNELINLSKSIAGDFNKELDVLLSSGEQVTCAL